jgi:hypothetical protein
MMDNKCKLKVNWVNAILLKDFLSYLELDVLKEISLLNVLVRKKLSPKLLRNLELSLDNYDFKFKDNIFIEYFNYLSDTRLPYNVCNKEKRWSCENGLSDFAYSLKNIKSFATSFQYINLSKAGYYLFPILSSMDKLVILHLRQSAIPYSSFANLGELLPHLKDIELFRVTLMSSSEDNNRYNGFNFPPNLRTLKVNECSLFDTGILSSPYQFLFNESTESSLVNFQLPIIKIPHLKNLSYHNSSYTDSSLEEFLEVNSELESLRITLFHFRMISQFAFLTSLEFDTLCHFDNTANIPNLKNAKRLKINYLSSRNYENIKILCLLCPNLEYLYFKMAPDVYFQHFVDSFLTPTLSNLFILKTLDLAILTSREEYLDISKISNIESLIIETKSCRILNCIFKCDINLRNVVFKSSDGKISYQEFKTKFSSYENWLFKFEKNIITGHKAV